MKNAIYTKILPAGEYFIGDLCYIIPDTYWSELCDQWFEGNKTNIEATYNGIMTYAFPTKWGDGTYIGSDGFSYGVDAGLIGIVEAVEDTQYSEDDNLFRRVKFDSPFAITTDGSTLIFGDIMIETDEEEEDEDFSDYDD